jgi:hypothetical protein
MSQARFDFDTDPVSWFYQNQIKGEEDFQARKADLRVEARKRLDAVSLWKDAEYQCACVRACIRGVRGVCNCTCCAGTQAPGRGEFVDGC